MTEELWERSTDPTELIRYMRTGASPRKLRLFACACCRRIWHMLIETHWRQGVELAERFSDGMISQDHLIHAATGIQRAEQGAFHGDPDHSGRSSFVAAVLSTLQVGPMLDERVSLDDGATWQVRRKPEHVVAAMGAANAALAHAQSVFLGEDPSSVAAMDAWRQARDAEKSAQAPLARDIFGNPFRPAAFDPRWRSADAVELARGIYEDRAFDRMPMLADALMDAGCDADDILTHCRAEGPHVRGCWVVDLILGKE